jgi:hypothetical protein
MVSQGFFDTQFGFIQNEQDLAHLAVDTQSRQPCHRAQVQ